MGEGLTNDALAVVAFSVVKTVVDQQYVTKKGGCTKIYDQALCKEFHMCEWVASSHVSSDNLNVQHVQDVQNVTNSDVTNTDGTCHDGHGEIDVWGKLV